MSVETPVSTPPPRAEPLAYHTPSSAEEREEVFAELCGYIREDGVATSDAAILAALAWDKLLRWLEQTPDYLRRLALARTQYQHELLREIGEAQSPDGTPDWHARTWLLQQRQKPEDPEPKAPEPTPPGQPLLVELTVENLLELQRRRMVELGHTEAPEEKAEAQPADSTENPPPPEPVVHTTAFADLMYRLQSSAPSPAQPPTPETLSARPCAEPASAPPRRPATCTEARRLRRDEKRARALLRKSLRKLAHQPRPSRVAPAGQSQISNLKSQISNLKSQISNPLPHPTDLLTPKLLPSPCPPSYPFDILHLANLPLRAPRKPSTPEEQEQIFAAIGATIRQHGSTPREAALLAEIDHRDLLAWREQNPGYAFRLAYAAAQHRRGGASVVREIRKPTGRGPWRRLTWLHRQNLAHEKDDRLLARARQSRPVTIDDTLTPENVADLERRRAAARAADAPNIERIEKAARERAAAAAPKTPPPPGALDSFARAHLRAHNLTLPPSAFQSCRQATDIRFLERCPHSVHHAPTPMLLALKYHAAGPAALAIAAMSALAAEDAPHAIMAQQHRTLLQDYCQKCHGAEKQKGKFRVDDLPLAITTLEAAERWQKVLNQMNSGDMPPDDEKQPDRAAKANFLDDLANTMVAARRSLGDQHGVITMRRLNRREYRNTLRELLGVEINVSELPSDTGTGGFDTVGSNLFMSGNQFEQYQTLGREALEEAFARQAAAAIAKKLHYEAETTTPIVENFVAHQIDARQRAQQWVKAVEEAAARPENAEIVAKIRQASKNDAIFRRFWEKIPGAPSPRSFGFDKKGENDADLANDSLGARWLAYHQYYLQQPAVDRGAYLGTQTRHPAELNVNYIELLVPFAWPVGEYVVRVRVAATDDAAPERRFLEFGIDPRGGQILSAHEVTGTMDAPQVIEIPLTLTRGNAERANRTLFIREKGSWDTNEEGGRKRSEALKRNGIGPEVALWVDWIEVERKPDTDAPKPPGIAALGLPLDDQSPAPVTPELRAALGRFALEAFRGTPPPATYLDRLLRLYDVRRQAGDKPAAALKETLSVVLASPMFLYLAEPSGDAKHRPLTDAELATRLSYFLWSAPPDATLRDLARRGELSKPEVLAAQTERLLDDPRSDGFITPFTHQWLGLDRLDFFQVYLALYPRFDNGTKLAARHEIYETLKYLVRHNDSLRDLLKADYVVIDSVLASYYGLAGVQGDDFHKVALPHGSPRGGLLGMAAIQFMGGNGEHTSPVERGAWVLRKLLDDPPPPAPANVPALTRLAGKVLTTRERIQAHQEDAQCASCHRKIDPIGFGLENFDAVGQWRSEDSYTAVNASGKPDPKTKKTWTIDPAAVLHNGPAFQDYYGLRDVVASRCDAFAHGFTTALIEYALGRPCGFSDEPLIADMVGQTRLKAFAAREFIHALVRSQEFHTK